MSELSLKKFKEEMYERKQQLAFRLDKIYFLKKHSNDVFNQLLKGGMEEQKVWAEEGGNGAGGPTVVQSYQ